MASNTLLGRAWIPAIALTGGLLGLVILAAFVQNRPNRPEARRELLTESYRLAEWIDEHAPEPMPFLRQLEEIVSQAEHLDDVERLMAQPPALEVQGPADAATVLDISYAIDASYRIERLWRQLDAESTEVHPRTAGATLVAATELRRHGGADAMLSADRLERSLVTPVRSEVVYWTAQDRREFLTLVRDCRQRIPTPSSMVARESWNARALLMAWSEAPPFEELRSRWTPGTEPWDVLDAVEALEWLKPYEKQMNSVISQLDEDAEIAYAVWHRALAQSSPLAFSCVTPIETLWTLGDTLLRSLAWEIDVYLADHPLATNDEVEARFRAVVADEIQCPSDLEFPGLSMTATGPALAPFPASCSRRVLARRSELEEAERARVLEEKKQRRRERARSLETTPNGQ